MLIGDQDSDTEIKLKKGRQLLFTVLCALVIPMLVAAIAINAFKNNHENQIVQSEANQTAMILARGLSIPVWNHDSEAAYDLILNQAVGTSIVAVRVQSLAQGEFLEYGKFPKIKSDDCYKASQDIIYEDQKIGQIDVLYDSAPFIKSQHDKWISIWATLIASILFSIAIIFWYLQTVVRQDHLAIATAAKNKVRSHRQHISDTANNVNGLVFQCVVDKNGTFAFPFMSDTISDHFNISSNEVIEKPQSFLSLIQSDDLEHFRNSLMRAALGNNDWAWEGRMHSPTGEFVFMRGVAKPRPFRDGLTLWNCVLSDVTELEKAQQKVAKARDNLEAEVSLRTKRLISEIEEKVRIESSLRDNEQRFKDFTETATDWVWETDENQNINFLSVNTATHELFDTSSVIGKSRYGLFNEKAGDEDGVWSKHYDDIALRKEFQDLEFDFTDLYGEQRRLRINGRPIFAESGNYIGYRGTGKDVTQETESKLGLEKLRSAFEAVPEPMAVLSSDGCFEFFNSALIEVNEETGKHLKLGVKFSDYIRKIVANGLITDAIGNEEAWIKKRLEIHQNSSGSFEINHTNGNWYLINEHALSTGGRALLMTNITALKESQQGLKEAKEQAESANEAKSNFLSSMSHELRTPLHAILGFAQLLERDGQGNLSQRQDKYVRQIVGSGNHLLRLIGDVLDLAQIESGNLSMSIESVDVMDAIKATIESASYLAITRDVTLRISRELSDNIPYVTADSTRVRQVLLNLASNGIKYTKENGIVEFDVKLIDDNFLQFIVRDNGHGIPEEKKAELFSAFSRLGMEKSDIEGTGIGLTISKAIIEEMGGSIGFESEPTTGTMFWFNLPIADASSTIEVPDARNSEKHNLKLRVLHVNESMINRELLETALSEQPGVDLTRSLQSDNPLQQIRDTLPDILFVDMDKDEEGRLKLIQSIKECPDTKHIPLVVLSLNRSDKSRTRVMSAGVTACLMMPLEPEKVFEQLEKVRTGGGGLH